MDQTVRKQSSIKASEGIVVSSCSLAELFSSKAIKASDGSFIKGQLHLPEYQRPYRWKKEEVGRLVNDLKQYFEPEQGSSTPKHKFYLGSIILHQNDGEHLLNIIDGQQRITTMGLLAWCLNHQGGSHPTIDLAFHAPESQSQIHQNLKWLLDQMLPYLDFSLINITLVVTRSEDDAYRFFETQNTGGVRLSGPDIIKAHHLRAIDRGQQNHFAKLWEKLGDLNPVVSALLKARYWQGLNFRELPSKRQPHQTRLTVVDELANRTDRGLDDLAFRPLAITRTVSGQIIQTADVEGYAARQPLNAGVNTVHYLQYFELLRSGLLNVNDQGTHEPFQQFYTELICEVDGCAYIKELYDSCLLVYLSHFGNENLFEAALWLFRVIYSIRVTNQKMVKEMSISRFVRDNPVYDWVLMSYSHKECIERLKEFPIEVSPENLAKEDVSVKKRFVKKVEHWFGIELPATKVAEMFDKSLVEAIKENSITRGSV